VLFGQERLDGLERADLAALELAHGVIERLQRAGHAQADEAGADAVERLGHRAAPSLGQATGDRVVEAERPDADASLRRRIKRSGRRRLAVSGIDAALVLASSTGCAAISAPSSKMRTSLGWFCTSRTRFRAVSGTL
jgi:hypothetical protein